MELLPDEERTVAPVVATEERVTGLTEAARVELAEERVTADLADDILADEFREVAAMVPARLVLLTRVPRPETTPLPAGWVALRAVQVL